MGNAAPEQPEKTATAFRTAEKHFQHLFKTHHTSNARSRRRAQALQQAKCASADLTQQGVVDVRQPAAVAAGLEQGALQRHVLPCAATQMGGAEPVPAAAATISVAEDCNGSRAQYGCQPSHPPPSHASDQSVLAYTLPAHPGFVLLPALLPVAHQLQLMCDALTRFPEPPATTNHNRQYGPLTGIWVAAQSGLTLKLGRQPEKGASSNGDAHAEGDAYSHPVQLGHEQQQQQHHEPSTRKFWDCWHRPLQLNGQGQQQSGGCAYLDAQNGARKPRAPAAAAAGPAPALNHLQPSHTDAAPGIQADPTSNGPCAGQSYLDAQNGAQNKVTAAAATTGRPAPALRHSRPQRATAAPSLQSPCTAFDHSTAQAPCNANDHNTAQAPTAAPSSSTAAAANTPAPTCSAPGGGATTGPSAASMLRRMRWASLGPQFDWTRRIYDDGAAHRPLPPSLELLARRTAGLVQQLTHLHSPQAPHAAGEAQAAQETPEDGAKGTYGPQALQVAQGSSENGARDAAEGALVVGSRRGCSLHRTCLCESKGMGGTACQDSSGSQLDGDQQGQMDVQARCGRDGGTVCQESMGSKLDGNQQRQVDVRARCGRDGGTACQESMGSKLDGDQQGQMDVQPRCGRDGGSACLEWTGSKPDDGQQQQQQQQQQQLLDMQAGRAYQPDAALVNYYYEGDTLGGHCDDVEVDLAQPIVAASIGCDAVFLMGGPTRDTAPTPLLLRSGDVVVLGGSARNCFHGVPRVFTDRPLPFGPEVLDTLPHSLLSELAASLTQQFPAELLRKASLPQQGASVSQQGPTEVQRPMEVQSPIEMQGRFGVQSKIEVQSPTEAHSPIEVRSPMEVQSPVEVRSPTEVQSSIEAQSPIEVQSPMGVQRMGAVSCVKSSHRAAGMLFLTEAHPGSRMEGGSAGEEGKGARTDVCKAKELLLPVLQHMQGCRINISVRAVR